MKTIYQDNKHYAQYFSTCLENKENFILKTTTNSAKIIKENLSINFNEGGRKNDTELKLITKVRSDAESYMSITDHKERENHIHFFDLFEIPDKDEIICKVDIKSAYWTYAIQRGVISEMTNRFFVEKFEGKPENYVKKVRLKALGSLATTRKFVEYKDGRRVLDSERVEVQKTKPIYMDICRGIDDIMRECTANIKGVIYYYWDCIFVKGEFSEEVINYFLDLKMNVSLEETRLKYISLPNRGFLQSYVIGKENKHGLPTKTYMVKGENKNYLDFLDDNKEICMVDGMFKKVNNRSNYTGLNSYFK